MAIQRRNAKTFNQSTFVQLSGVNCNTVRLNFPFAVRILLIIDESVLESIFKRKMMHALHAFLNATHSMVHAAQQLKFKQTRTSVQLWTQICRVLQKLQHLWKSGPKTAFLETLYMLGQTCRFVRQTPHRVMPFSRQLVII